MKNNNNERMHLLYLYVYFFLHNLYKLQIFIHFLLVILNSDASLKSDANFV